MTDIDVRENKIYKVDSRLLEILLLDRTTKKNLIWATDNYVSCMFGCQAKTMGVKYNNEKTGWNKEKWRLS